MGRKEYPCDGIMGECPFYDEFGNMTGNCRDNCGLGVDEDKVEEEEQCGE